jgi:poly-gamma-glutamate synthesis protein (capsule biosynthesis protein)
MTAAGPSLLLAGDAFIARPWSAVADPGFMRLVNLIRSADVAIANLETVIHEFKGYPQADSGGTWAHAPPAIAAELAWAGFDLLAHANNHSFDYGSTGVVETHEHADRAGLVLAGSGGDLQEARAPRYVSRSGHTVGMVAMTSTYALYGRASRTRADAAGRPGLNPLAVHLRRPTVSVPARFMPMLRRAAKRFGKRFVELEGDGFELFARVLEGSPAVFRDRWPKRADRDGNLAAIAEAARHADVVIASIHAHFQGRWLRKFAAEAIDHGADIVHVHGPHEVRGVEFHRGRPIFYSLGDFVYEAEYVPVQPSDAYDKRGLGEAATIAELRAAPSATRSLWEKRATFEGAVASLQFAEGRAERIRLHPIDLNFDATDEARGRPRLADPETGRRIIAQVAERSKGLNARIAFDAAESVGVVEMAGR